MDQDSTGKSGSRSWRDRLGIDESRKDASEATPAPKPQAPQPSGGQQVTSKVVARPAPMAPRPGTAALAPRPAPQASQPQAPQPQPAPLRASQDDAFAERLRKHREAAEEAVKKRTAASSSLEKFSFARKEVETAQAEKVEPRVVQPSAPPQPPAPPAQSAAPQPVAQPYPPVPAPYPSPAPSSQQPPAPPRPPAPMGRPAPQAMPPQAPQYQPPRPGYGQPSYPPQQPQPAYRPQGPGYAPPPGARPMPPAGYQPPQPGGYPQPPRPPAPPAPQARSPRAPYGDDDLFEDNGYRPAQPIGRAPEARTPAPRNEPLRADFDDPFDDDAPGGNYSGRTARDYAQAYREYDDDFEDEQPRRWGGIVMLILALLAMAALAIGLIYMYKSQKPATGDAGGAVPTVSAPQEPVKAEPDAAAPQQEGTAPAQGRKLIYERLLSGDGANQPEQIVPREETPIAPPAGNSDSDSLPLPLPPPPQTQGSLQPGGAAPEPAEQVANADVRTDNQEGAAGVEPAASAVSSGPITNPPVPRLKPRNLVAAVEQAPATEFRPVVQPAPAPAPAPFPQAEPQPLPGLLPAPSDQSSSQAGSLFSPVEPVPGTAQQQPARPTRAGARDDDPLAGTRTPFNQTVTGSPPAQAAPQVLQQQQQVALAPPPAPAPAVQQPVTSESLQAFAPPAQPQPQVTAPSGEGYVIQLAAYRSEQEAMSQYQQLRTRHGNLLGNLPPAVQQTNLGASGTFYRLGMGPLQSKQAATELCNKLIAAGERDCLVRRR
jgi:cell division septation protein DedD